MMSAYFAVLGDDRAPAPADLADRFVPSDALESIAAVGAGALRPDAAQGIHQPVGIAVVVMEVLELHAQGAARDRMLLVAVHVDELAILDLVEHRAGVGAVVRAGAEEGGARALLVHVSPVGLVPFAADARACLLLCGSLTQVRLACKHVGKGRQPLGGQNDLGAADPRVEHRSGGWCKSCWRLTRRASSADTDGRHPRATRACRRSQA